MHNGYPLYLKLCTDVNDGKTTLIALLTDIRSSLWMEYFGEARAIHFRIKVSARETPKSTYADLKQEEAVTRLLQDLEQYTNTSDSEATTKSDSDAEVNKRWPYHLRLGMFASCLLTSGNNRWSLFYNSIVSHSVSDWTKSPRNSRLACCMIWYISHC